MTTQREAPWDGAYKIPWDDPDFSRRILAEHLTQDHDLASRRTEWIDRQVAWIHGRLLDGKPARILDLGCGPGLYSHRLAKRGHRCRGIDFGPASIEYARLHNPDEARCEFAPGDIRQVAFGGPYDLVMILYGEFNVFSPGEVRDILRKARESLLPGGSLIAEVQTPAAVEQTGRDQPTQWELERGLFCDQAHLYRVESRWLKEERTAVQTFTITETATLETRVYRSTTKAWEDGDLAALLEEAGLGHVAPWPDWPCNTEGLRLWGARRD